MTTSQNDSKQGALSLEEIEDILDEIEIAEKKFDRNDQKLSCDSDGISKCAFTPTIMRLLNCYQQQSYAVDIDQVEILNHFFHIKYDHRMNEDDDLFRLFYDQIISRGIPPCDVSECDAMKYHFRDRTKDIDRHVTNALKDTTEKQIKDLICRIHCYFMHSFDIHKLNAQEIKRVEAMINEEEKASLVRQIMAEKSNKVSGYINPPNDNDAKQNQIVDNATEKEKMIKRFGDLVEADHTASALFLEACDWVFTAAVDWYFRCNGKVETLRQRIADRDVYYAMCNADDGCLPLYQWLRKQEYDTDSLYYDFVTESNVFCYFSDQVTHSKMFRYHKLRHCITSQYNWNAKHDAVEEMDDEDDFVDYTNALGDKESGNIQIYNRGVKYWYWDTMKHHKMFIAAKHNDLKDEILENDLLDCSKKQWLSLHENCSILCQSEYVQRLASNNNEDNATIYGILKHNALTISHVCAIKLYTDYSEWCSTFCSVFRRSKIGINTYESLQSMKKKAKQFAHWARLITEVVQCFGCVTEDGKVFYRGIKGTFTFSSFIARYNVPLSTSLDVAPAHTFADNDGFILQMVQYQNYHSFHFKCEPFSHYGHEDEELFFGGDTILKIQSIVELTPGNKPVSHQLFVAAVQQILRLMRGVDMELHLSKQVENKIIDLFKHCLDIQIIPNLPMFIANGIFYYLQHRPKLNMSDLMKKYEFMKQIFVKQIDAEDVLNVKNICNLFQYSKYIVISMPSGFILNEVWGSSIYSDLKEVQNIKLVLEWEISVPEETAYVLRQMQNKMNSIQWEVELNAQSVTFIWDQNIQPKIVPLASVEPPVADNSDAIVAQRMRSIIRKQDEKFKSLDDDDECHIDGLVELKSGGRVPKSFLISETEASLSGFVTTIFECGIDKNEQMQKYLSVEDCESFSNGYFREIEGKLNVLVLPLVRHAIMKFYNYSVPIIEIRQVPPETLEHVISYLKHHKGVEPDPLPCPVRSIHMQQIVSDKWDATWIDAFDKKTIYEIILAANYMDVKSLLHLGCAKIATLIKQLDQKEINRIIEEEEKYRREHAQNDAAKAEEKDEMENEAIQSFSNTKLTYKSSRRLLSGKSVQRIRSLNKDDWEDGDSSDLETDDEDDKPNNK